MAPIVALAFICMLMQACERPGWPNSRIRQIGGGRTLNLPYGRISTLEVLVRDGRALAPGGQVVVAVVFPRQYDRASGSTSSSGNGMEDNTCWYDTFAVRYRVGAKIETRSMKWNYCAATRKIVYDGVPFDLPESKIGVIRLDEKWQPSFELRVDTQEVIKSLRLELGGIDEEKANVVDALPIP